jgi:hypothetical protein
VADEAAKLFGALSDWAHDHQPDAAQAGEGLGHLAGRAAAALHEFGEHVDTGSPECDWCPVCRTVHLVRTASPEVRGHLASAVESLAQAAAGFLAAAGTPRERTEPGVERIDLDDDTAAAEWPEEDG